MSELIADAMLFARDAHAGQQRKYTGEPYIVHPCAVAGLVAAFTNDDEVIAAAFLHDVVEDTCVTIPDIVDRFGRRVADLVAQVTDASGGKDGDRAARKAVDCEHLARACPEAQTIKLADMIDNTKTVGALDPEFAATYLAEKRNVLDVLTNGNARLWLVAASQIERWMGNKAASGRGNK